MFLLQDPDSHKDLGLVVSKFDSIYDAGMQNQGRSYDELVQQLLQLVLVAADQDPDSHKDLGLVVSKFDRRDEVGYFVVVYLH